MSTIYFISLCMSFILSYYDIKYQEYPIFSMDIIHHFNDNSHTDYKSFYCFMFIWDFS